MYKHVQVNDNVKYAGVAVRLFVVLLPLAVVRDLLPVQDWTKNEPQEQRPHVFEPCNAGGPTETYIYAVCRVSEVKLDILEDILKPKNAEKPDDFALQAYRLD